MEYYSAIRKDEYPPFASTWMELEGIMLSEISQAESSRERQLSYSFTHSLKLRVTEQKGVGEWGGRVMAIKEGTCCDEHWVLYMTNELLNTTTKTYDILYAG